MAPDELGPRTEPKVATYYPHLLCEDCAIWTEWLKKNPSRLTGVWYDVHVGDPMPIPQALGPWANIMVPAISRKRIDVVATDDHELWVIEIKPYANFTALGQVIAYHRLFLRDYQPKLPTIPVVICATLDPDLADDFQQHHVRIEQTGYPTFS